LVPEKENFRSFSIRIMTRVCVLGAGYMGSAITFPLSDNGNGIHLWGTWLDNWILDECSRGQHPKLNKSIPENVSLFYAGELEEAIEDVEFLIIAVTSEGFVPVFQRALDAMKRSSPLFCLTKGFVPVSGEVNRISEVARCMFHEKFPGEEFRWVSVGGPVKAVELSDRVPTSTMFGMNSSVVTPLLRLFSTDYYFVSYCDDVCGVELCSAFKNVYAIGLGIYDGLYEVERDKYSHNLKSILFNQSVQEMALLIERAGGRRETAFGLSGIGDLYVTSASGRNRRFGEYLGKQYTPNDAYRLMNEEGEIAEGYHAVHHGMKFINTLENSLIEELPLFEMLYRIIVQNKNVEDELRRFLKGLGMQ
jgi:glycerol-3-phosphate dehydrogenase (NAD(P)+)